MLIETRAWPQSTSPEDACSVILMPGSPGTRARTPRITLHAPALESVSCFETEIAGKRTWRKGAGEGSFLASSGGGFAEGLQREQSAAFLVLLCAPAALLGEDRRPEPEWAVRLPLNPPKIQHLRMNTLSD